MISLPPNYLHSGVLVVFDGYIIILIILHTFNKVGDDTQSLLYGKDEHKIVPGGVHVSP